MSIDSWENRCYVGGGGGGGGAGGGGAGGGVGVDSNFNNLEI